MKPSSSISSGSLNRMLQAADAAWERNDHDECMETLQRARRIAPSNTSILLRLGRAHGLRYDYVSAENCFEKALDVAPEKTGMLMAIAEQCENFRRFELAQNYLQRAVAQPDAPPVACIKLAELYERLRRLPEATQLVQRALMINPAYPPARIVCARLERLAGRLEQAEQILRSLFNRPHPADWTHTQGWYELATVLDRQGKYDEAMTALSEAKAFFLPLAARRLAELKMVRDRLKTMESNVSSAMFQRWLNAGAELVPTQRLALLCGHARSGTTLLEQVLDSHPDVVSAEETGAFLECAFAPLQKTQPPGALMLPVLEAAEIQAINKARAAYLQSMEQIVDSPVANRLLLDKNPALTFMIPAFIRIFPETKFVIALRDPRDVVLSCFMQNLPLTQLGAAYLKLETTVDDYANLMSNWLKLAPLIPGRYLEVRYEEMVLDLESVARRALEFLELPWDAKVLGFDEHARNKAVRSPTYADVTQPVYQRAMGRWRNYQKYLEPHLKKLQPFVNAFGYE